MSAPRCAFCERPIDVTVGLLLVTETTPTQEYVHAFCTHLCALPWLAGVVRDMTLRMPRR